MKGVTTQWKMLSCLMVNGSVQFLYSISKAVKPVFQKSCILLKQRGSEWLGSEAAGDQKKQRLHRSLPFAALPFLSVPSYQQKCAFYIFNS